MIALSNLDLLGSFRQSDSESDWIVSSALLLATPVPVVPILRVNAITFTEDVINRFHCLPTIDFDKGKAQVVSECQDLRL